jgi:hypothetical protein
LKSTLKFPSNFTLISPVTFWWALNQFTDRLYHLLLYSQLNLNVILTVIFFDSPPLHCTSFRHRSINAKNSPVTRQCWIFTVTFPLGLSTCTIAVWFSLCFASRRLRKEPHAAGSVHGLGLKRCISDLNTAIRPLSFKRPVDRQLKGGLCAEKERERETARWCPCCCLKRQ